MVSFERLITVSYSYSIAVLMAVSLAVSTQYTNVSDSHPATQPPHDSKGRNWAKHCAAKICYTVTIQHAVYDYVETLQKN